MAGFNLKLHPDKTRLLEFGRFATERRVRQGKAKPETFDFLGFTHICGKKRNGKFTVMRKTMRKRMGAKLKELKSSLRERMHDSIPEVGKWLASVLRGHYQYYGVPGNSPAMGAFRMVVARMWYKTLSRRSQKGRIKWSRMNALVKRWLPSPRIQHPWPDERLCV
jgi:RNA-directed DNA polymerase